jgi:DNA-3-methyladenine glycosylase
MLLVGLYIQNPFRWHRNGFSSAFFEIDSCDTMRCMGRRKIISADFFERSSVAAAQDLLGKYLVRSENGRAEAFRIVETEAYEGMEDRASHASRGKTPRNAPMFEQAGMIYVYFTYGIHWMLNIVCGPEGHPSAVLIRGIEGCIGPARLTKKLGIDKELNGLVLGKKSGLWIEEDVEKDGVPKKLKIKKTPRIGVSSAGPLWAGKKYRFLIQE